MAGRILSLQRQARELGRLRSGYTDTSGARPRPVRSATWILTSHNEDYVKAAAALWGGAPEKWEPLGNGAAQWRVITETSAIDAIMPPGDPLSQANELWSRGGISRRCDGITDQISDSPCVCLAQFGEDFHKQPKDKRCSATSRLSLILPEMPDVGVFRVETKSYFAANEIAATVDVIRAATGGNSLVPVQVRIEPRTTTSEGKTKQYPVVVLALRGATAGQILSGTAPGLSSGYAPAGVNTSTGEISATHTTSLPPHLAIEPAPSDCSEFINRAMESRTAAQVRDIWRDAAAAGCIEAIVAKEGMTLKMMLTTLGQRFAELEAAPVAAPVTEPAREVSPVAAWTALLASWPSDTQSALDAFHRASGGREPAACTADEIAQFAAMMAVPVEEPVTKSGVSDGGSSDMEAAPF